MEPAPDLSDWLAAWDEETRPAVAVGTAWFGTVAAADEPGRAGDREAAESLPSLFIPDGARLTSHAYFQLLLSVFCPDWSAPLSASSFESESFLPISTAVHANDDESDPMDGPMADLQPLLPTILGDATEQFLRACEQDLLAICHKRLQLPTPADGAPQIHGLHPFALNSFKNTRSRKEKHFNSLF